MSFSVDSADLVNALVNVALDKHNRSFLNDRKQTIRSEGLYITLDLRVHNYTEDISTFRFAHFLFCGNVSVWFATTDEYCNLNQICNDQWINTSNHDVCWRTDGVERPLWTTYFTMTTEVLEASENKELCPNDLHNQSFLSFTPVRRVIIDYRQDDENKYRRKIVRVKSLGA